MRIIFVYNSKCARTTLSKGLSNGDITILLNAEEIDSYAIFFVSVLLRFWF